MDLVNLTFIAILGLVVGSFISAFTYRYPKGIPIARGRSFCDKCKHQLNWYTNIPVLSYLVLGGRCQYCHTHISARYPIIEVATTLTFVTLFVGLGTIIGNVTWLVPLGILQLPLLFVLAALLVAIFVIDFEHQIIPDLLVLELVVLTLSALLLSNSQQFFSHILAALVAAFILLIIHLATHGKGMGLGDVKLAIFAGLFLGLPLSLWWLLASFMLGGLVGIFLLLLRQAQLTDKIAFGPFLIFGFFAVLLSSIEMLKGGII